MLTKGGWSSTLNYFASSNLKIEIPRVLANFALELTRTLKTVVEIAYREMASQSLWLALLILFL
jgi:hypothetical protein